MQAARRIYSHLRRKALDDAATALEPSFKLTFPRHNPYQTALGTSV
jgi:hypothetical protein